ncbi:hypothetical protein AB0D67_03710 [Streptosporangium sp. NPDC048047]|uniref:hypothetical protein n=1 Tax=Streptosporangium sp. NPDC048047 TaxID=3155748 RepID=UPI003448583A
MDTASSAGRPAPEQLSAPGASGVGGRRLRPSAAWRWLPTALVTALVTGTLLFYGVSVRDLAAFGCYVALCLALPGTLLVRALYGGARTLAEELALGLALGYAVEAGVYVAARAAGAPLAVLAWPAVTYAVFLAVPGLRRHWRGRARRPVTPVWWPAALSLVMTYLVVLSAARFFRGNALGWPTLAASDLDIPFHLALIGELRHHMPPTVPAVAGEPLLYHWFVYAHFAAASWVTGVEPLVLLLRLSMLPMLAALVVLLAMTARRLTGSPGGALLAVGGTFLATAPNLYAGPSLGTFTWRSVHGWTSPTQTFGALLFAPVVLLLLDLVAGRRGAGRWLLLGVFLVAMTGAKATYLPPLAAGLAVVAAVEAVRRRRPPWSALAALGMTGACVLYGQAVLFGGARQAMVVDPLSLLRPAWAGLTGHDLGDAPAPGSLATLAAVYLLCLLITWAGVLGLLVRPGLLLRPGVLLMLGMGAACLGVVLLFGHPGQGQLYFFSAACPYLTTVAAYGLVTAVRRGRMPPAAVGAAAVAGMVAACAVRVACGTRVPLPPGRPESDLYLPYAALFALVVLGAAVLAVRRAGPRPWAALVVALAAVGLPAAWCLRALSAAEGVPTGSPLEGVPPVAARDVPREALAAGRWLRDHSGPDDLVATNTHCRWGFENPCDSRQFWAAALTERRVLVEGWTYTAANMSRWRPGQAPETFPFWDTARMRANDAAFAAPSASALRELRERYGVRWLLADERAGRTSPELGAYAPLRFRSGDYAVYRVPG